MALTRWSPALDFVQVHNELDRVFNDVFKSVGVPGNWGSENTTIAAQFLPVDITRTDSALHIEASVPGFEPEQVEVTVDNGVLTVHAERRVENASPTSDYLRRERYQGTLYRQVTLGEGVDGEKATASFHNGVLSIDIPLVARPEPKRIPVSSANGSKR